MKNIHLVLFALLFAACVPASGGTGISMWIFTGHHWYVVGSEARCTWDTQPYAADCEHYALEVTPSAYRFAHTDTIATSVYFADAGVEIYFSDCIVMPNGGNPFTEYCLHSSDEIFSDVQSPP